MPCISLINTTGLPNLKIKSKNTLMMTTYWLYNGSFLVVLAYFSQWITQSNKLTLCKFTYSIHSYLRRPCLQLHVLLQLPQTPHYPVKMSLSHRQLSQAYSQFPSAQYSQHWAHPRYYPPTYSKIFVSLPLTPQPPSPTNRELYPSRLDKHVQEI